MPTVRLGSEGSHGGGVPELEDVDAAITRVRQEAEGPTVVAGWSFGAGVALRQAVRDARIAALALVALPAGPDSVTDLPPPAPGDLERLAAPVLFVVGSLDRLTSMNALQALAGRISRGRLLVMPGTGHYFERREAELAEVVGEFVEPVLGEDPSVGPQ